MKFFNLEMNEDLLANDAKVSTYWKTNGTPNFGSIDEKAHSRSVFKNIMIEVSNKDL